MESLCQQSRRNRQRRGRKRKTRIMPERRAIVDKGSVLVEAALVIPLLWLFLAGIVQCGTQNSGNWGKIDLDGNSSSGTVYTSLMLNNLCDDSFAPGNWVSAGTGNAQISQVFQSLLSDTSPPLAWSNLVFAVTSDFPQGNGLVQIRRFMRVDVLSQRGNGQGWSLTMRVVQLDAQPDSRTPGRRQLVE